MYSITFNMQKLHVLLRVISTFIVTRHSSEDMIKWVNALKHEEEVLFSGLKECSEMSRERTCMCEHKAEESVAVPTSDMDGEVKRDDV